MWELKGQKKRSACKLLHVSKTGSDKRDPLQCLTQTVLLVVSLPALFREDRTEDDNVSSSKEG